MIRLLVFLVVLLASSARGQDTEALQLNVTIQPQSPTTYTTTFSTPQTPIGMQDGRQWYNHTEDIDASGSFAKFNVTDGHAISPGACAIHINDGLAHLEGFPANDYIEGTVYRSGDFAQVQELELHLRSNTSATTPKVRTYEILWNVITVPGVGDIGVIGVVRWIGNAGSDDFYTGCIEGRGCSLPTVPASLASGVPNQGDRLRAEIVGNVITLKLMNVGATTWTTLGTATDSYPGAIATGSPGIGACSSDSPTFGQNLRLGWDAITAGPMP